jgi:hypothetical protein
VITGAARGAYEQFMGSVAEDGQYTIDGVPLGPCALAVNLPRSGTHYYTVNVAGAITSYDVALPQGQFVVHLPVAATDAQNPPHVLVFLRDDAAFSDFQSAWLSFDPSGNCTVTNLEPGDYVLSASIPGQIPPRVGTARLEGPTARVEVELRAPEHTGWIAGALPGLAPPLGVLDTTGPSIAAMPRGAQGYDPAACYYGIANAQNGTYRVPDLPVGTYAVRVCSYSQGTPLPFFFSPDVEVRAGLVRELDLAIPPARDVLVRLTYEGTQPARAVWRLRFPNGAWIPAGSIVGSHGSSTFATVMPFRLPFGEYLLEADFGTGTPVLHTFIVELGDGVHEVVVPRP